MQGDRGRRADWGSARTYAEAIPTVRDVVMTGVVWGMEGTGSPRPRYAPRSSMWSPFVVTVIERIVVGVLPVQRVPSGCEDLGLGPLRRERPRLVGVDI